MRRFILPFLVLSLFTIPFLLPKNSLAQSNDCDYLGGRCVRGSCSDGQLQILRGTCSGREDFCCTQNQTSNDQGQPIQYKSCGTVPHGGLWSQNSCLYQCNDGSASVIGNCSGDSVAPPGGGSVPIVPPPGNAPPPAPRECKTIFGNTYPHGHVFIDGPCDLVCSDGGIKISCTPTAVSDYSGTTVICANDSDCTSKKGPGYRCLAAFVGVCAKVESTQTAPVSQTCSQANGACLKTTSCTLEGRTSVAGSCDGTDIICCSKENTTISSCQNDLECRQKRGRDFYCSFVEIAGKEIGSCIKPPVKTCNTPEDTENCVERGFVCNEIAGVKTCIPPTSSAPITIEANTVCLWNAGCECTINGQKVTAKYSEFCGENTNACPGQCVDKPGIYLARPDGDTLTCDTIQGLPISGKLCPKGSLSACCTKDTAVKGGEFCPTSAKQCICETRDLIPPGGYCEPTIESQNICTDPNGCFCPVFNKAIPQGTECKCTFWPAIWTCYPEFEDKIKKNQDCWGALSDLPEGASFNDEINKCIGQAFGIVTDTAFLGSFTNFTEGADRLIACTNEQHEKSQQTYETLKNTYGDWTATVSLFWNRTGGAIVNCFWPAIETVGSATDILGGWNAIIKGIGGIIDNVFTIADDIDNVLTSGGKLTRAEFENGLRLGKFNDLCPFANIDADFYACLDKLGFIDNTQSYGVGIGGGVDDFSDYLGVQRDLGDYYVFEPDDLNFSRPLSEGSLGQTYRQGQAVHKIFKEPIPLDNFLNSNMTGMTDAQKINFSQIIYYQNYGGQGALPEFGGLIIENEQVIGFTQKYVANSVNFVDAFTAQGNRLTQTQADQLVDLVKAEQQINGGQVLGDVYKVNSDIINASNILIEVDPNTGLPLLNADGTFKNVALIDQIGAYGSSVIESRLTPQIEVELFEESINEFVRE